MAEDVLRDAKAFHESNTNCLGFIFGGDGNPQETHWQIAFDRVPDWNLVFHEPTFTYATVSRASAVHEAKPGDCMSASSFVGRRKNLLRGGKQATAQGGNVKITVLQTVATNVGIKQR